MNNSTDKIVQSNGIRSSLIMLPSHGPQTVLNSLGYLYIPYGEIKSNRYSSICSATSMIGACVFFNCKKKKNSLADTHLESSLSD